MNINRLHPDMRRQLDYLSVSPWEAIIAMINDQYHYGLDPETTVLVDREDRGGGVIDITIAVPRSERLPALLPPVQQTTFRLKLLDLEECFGSYTIILRSELPTVGYRYSDLLKYLVLKSFPGLTHFQVDLEDLEDSWLLRGPDVTLSEHTLKAHPLSLRWSGEMRVDITDLGESRVPYTTDMGTVG